MFVALMLSSPPGAGADIVTWRKCAVVDDYRRVMKTSSDNEATLLHLYDCNLRDVRSGDFYGLPNVTKIKLLFNDIAHVEPVAFRDLPKLTLLDMEHNALQEAPVFDEHSFCPSLITLLLNRNIITELKHPSTFSGCEELQNINLGDNVIEYINPDIFRPLSKLTKLEIYRNRLIVIPETLLIYNVKLAHLNLCGNKIHFLPLDLVSKLRMAGAPLNVFYFFDNPWHCACLLELLADAKRAGVPEIDPPGWYTGTVPSCVYSGAFPCSRRAPAGLLGRAGKHPLAHGSYLVQGPSG